MKKGTIVARKRFLQKYGNKIINGILIFSIIVFVSTLIVTNVAKAKPDTNIDTMIANADTKDNDINIVEIIAYNENEIMVEGGVTYYYENADLKIQPYANEGIKCNAVIVNGTCTSIMFDISNVNNKDKGD